MAFDPKVCETTYIQLTEEMQPTYYLLVLLASDCMPALLEAGRPQSGMHADLHSGAFSLGIPQASLSDYPVLHMASISGVATRECHLMSLRKTNTSYA